MNSSRKQTSNGVRILVSASDPGGAYAILPVVKALKKKNNLTLVLGGKARDVFRTAGFKVPPPSIPPHWWGRKGGGVFLAGTSFGPTIDKKLLLEARIRKIPSVYVLDFWSNYWQRFSTKKKDFKFLPDYICVMDEQAKKEMTAEGFPTKKLIVTGNPYFEQFTLNNQKQKPRAQRILFISQPLREAPAVLADYGYDEYQVLTDLIEAVPDRKITVRLHPREQKNKFSNLPVRFDETRDLEKSLLKSGAVVGMNSAALFEAALLGLNVVSYQPNLKGKDRLPSNKLGLSKLVKNKTGLIKALTAKHHKKKRGIKIRHATQNIVKFITALHAKT